VESQDFAAAFLLRSHAKISDGLTAINGFALVPTATFTIAAVTILACSGAAADDLGAPSALRHSAWFAERTLTEPADPQVRIHANEPNAAEAAATRMLLYALPNGNTIEQTLGCKLTPGLDWHYDIQHVAAQVRLLREINPDERLVLVCAEAGGLSWPNWRSSRPDGNARIAKLLDEWRTRFGGGDCKVTLSGHSGGGSFIFGVIEGAEEIPAYVDRIAILDANYAFDGEKHAAKLVRWLNGDNSRRLIVLAYDDRNIELNGKRVVGPEGGTFRATQRMVEAFTPYFAITKSTADPFVEYSGLDSRVRFYVHSNPQNKILHTALVGDMNGLVHAQTLGTRAEGTWGAFGGPRAYEKWIQPRPTSVESESAAVGENSTLYGINHFPKRPPDAIGGRAFMSSIAGLSREQRETAILKEITHGNIPDFLRRWKSVLIATDAMRGTISVMPDYLAVGSDDDFVRVPMTPQTAQQIADRFDCTLPTRRMVDAIDAAAEVRLAPQPLTEDRESVAAFLLSNDRIESQRAGKPLGALTIGAKKDVVLSPRIHEHPGRVAIYGWRQLDGTPIQPLTTVHVNWYVDYSHGVRLVRDWITIDGEVAKITDLLRDPQRCALVSDEGPVDPPRYPTPPAS
jgi:hypothetical protein